ncbi:MAG: indole-3-glycerol phosphate synthase [Pontimonas sp.]
MLDGLFLGAREDAAKREATLPRTEIEALARDAAPVRSAINALGVRPKIHVIAEIKRRSPSKGALADIVDPVALATQYEAGGASVISVLTEGRRFGGSLEDLSSISRAVSIPVLRKDFLDTEYQIIEARAHGADLVLLIMAWLSDDLATRLLALAAEWGMHALVEAHSGEEVDRAVALGAGIVGINARNLTTFEVDPGLFGTLVARIPEGIVTVAESAVVNSQDVTRYREQGAQAVLVGESLVTGTDPEQRVKEFVAA